MNEESLASRLGALYEERDVGTLARILFGRSLYPGQVDIARLTAFLEHDRAAVCCYTQYGKTFGMGTGLAVDLVMDPRPRKIALVGPRAEQARLIRAEFLASATASPLGLRELGLTKKGAERVKDKRVNRFITRSGKEYKVLTTGKDSASAGEGLMGHGVDNTPPQRADDAGDVDDETDFVGAAGLVIVTEAGLVPEAAWPKITRMLGDAGKLYVEGNPWAKGSGFHRFYEATGTHRIHIDWEQGVREGRISRARVMEERASMPPLFFTVLYESLFPDAAEDQLIPWDHIQRATIPLREWLVRCEERFALDVAEGGADLTVLTMGEVARVNGRDEYRVIKQVAWSEPDTMQTVERAAALMPPGATIIIDTVGPGRGVADALRRHAKRFNVCEFKAGETAREKDRYANMGSEAYWQARVAFAEKRVQIPEHQVLKLQLMQPRWETDGKRVRVDKHGEQEKSPDHADSLIMFMHGGRGGRASTVQKGQKRMPSDWRPGELYGTTWRIGQG